MARRKAQCYDCGHRYGEQYGFPDMCVPFDVWKKIRPENTVDDGGLLCPCCILIRLHRAKIKSTATIFSRNAKFVSPSEFNILGRIENIGLALQGRINGIAGVLPMLNARITCLEDHVAH